MNLEPNVLSGLCCGCLKLCILDRIFPSSTWFLCSSLARTSIAGRQRYLVKLISHNISEPVSVLSLHQHSNENTMLLLVLSDSALPVIETVPD